MTWLKILVLALAGTGVTWAAQHADEQPESMSEAELEAELERIEQAVDENDELEEFKPSKPLAADLGVALPSDI